MKFDVVCFASLLLGGVSNLAAIPLYTVTELPSFNVYQVYWAINNQGEATGYQSDGSTTRAFIYRDGRITDLGTLGGRNNYSSGLQSHSINDSGQVTGSSETASFCCHAFLYSNGQIVDLGTLGGQSSSGRAINADSQVTGDAQTAGPNSHAFLYSNGVMTDLGTLGAPAGNSVGYGINGRGQVTGLSATASGVVHAFLYSNGEMHDLGTLVGSGGGSYGFDINDDSEVTGESQTDSGNYHAFLYVDGQLMDLGTLGGQESSGGSLNNYGQITGISETADGATHAFLYSNGVMHDLNSSIDPSLGITLTEGMDINDNGQILANGGNHQYLLTPIPESGGATLVFIGLLIAMCRAASLDRTYRSRLKAGYRDRGRKRRDNQPTTPRFTNVYARASARHYRPARGF